MPGVISLILAGGEGTRLFPLTQSRSKPAVPFAGQYRLIDFVLNNFVNSDLLKIFILTQFKSQSLNVHLRQAWHMSGITDRFIDPVPAQMRMGKRWYEGTADAIYQNMRIIQLHDPDHVCVFGSDHIYKMDVRQMVDLHKKRNAKCSVAAIKVPIAEATEFGVIEINEDWKMTGFVEKPLHPTPIPGEPDFALVSMGNYVFEAETLYKELERDAKVTESNHDFGKNIIPNLCKNGDVFVYDFTRNQIEKDNGNQMYWRDVGTIDSYWKTNMELLVKEPELDLYNPRWPMRTYHPPMPPAQIRSSREGKESVIKNCAISAGCEIFGATIDHSVLGYDVKVKTNADIFETVLMGHNRIGKGVVLNKCVLDKHVHVADDVKIGINHEHDRKRGFTISPNGITVVPQNTKVIE
ncbi:glucose-1-phosphate adenylyltransferase [Psychrosphaera sp. F3M07]|jgi:glucose-1-phosphate adenylyltransferase|uniref:glucose-1-phosphate adenylyltransferase n=1 Tax=Psychrosphaera sp. F3M07 TaxID=2841560 RepID=UPI001C09464C|nr:glucose-1-phosphate adenylyltransferase [Psychrosphaera sp. F3M07]MBU2919082.1 glucose-1-phosphate adenylyltransferase [Psychrosphaera sp. F3M07]